MCRVQYIEEVAMRRCDEVGDIVSSGESCVAAIHDCNGAGGCSCWLAWACTGLCGSRVEV